ncbi:MAG: pyridoxamine 5'-phosphate oxidase family protein, partial [Deltaproteobacteria bacterium]|nr:pyridoxamine 5'-phosphate oxidase family protein [Deltaproteobacteria bacterium]
MTLRDYFDTATGTGILATADKEGNVNAAIYSRPHFMEDESIAFIMADRMTHFNLQSNPRAVYLFRESGARVVACRFGIVLGRGGGALRQMLSTGTPGTCKPSGKRKPMVLLDSRGGPGPHLSAP